MSTETDAFSALDHIIEGDWDRFLLRLRAAINHGACCACHTDTQYRRLQRNLTDKGASNGQG